MPPVDPVAVVTVDDQAVFREVAREVIDLAPGFESVGEAASGQEALRIVSEVEPDLVLCDVRMPGMDGIEVARRLRAAHPAVVVVLVSLAEQAELPSEAATCGAAAVVAKRSFGPSLLRDLWVRHRRA